MSEWITKCSCYQWKLSDKLEVKLNIPRCNYITFVRICGSGRKRTLRMSINEFQVMMPNFSSQEALAPFPQDFNFGKEIFLGSTGQNVKLTRFCKTRDNKRVDSSFIIFNCEEWHTFLQLIKDIQTRFEEHTISEQ